MTLAATLGHVNVDHMLDQITPEQFIEWQAWLVVEQGGDQWHQTALLAAVIHNTQVVKRSDLASPDDYLPQFNVGNDKATDTDEAERLIAAQYGNSS